MNTFDKFCAAIAFLLGIVFVILGGIGVFTGCSANFKLPPILGVLPALAGWGIMKSVRVAWHATPKGPIITGSPESTNL